MIFLSDCPPGQVGVQYCDHCPCMVKERVLLSHLAFDPKSFVAVAEVLMDTRQLKYWTRQVNWADYWTRCFRQCFRVSHSLTLLTLLHSTGIFQIWSNSGANLSEAHMHFSWTFAPTMNSAHLYYFGWQFASQVPSGLLWSLHFASRKADFS